MGQREFTMQSGETSAMTEGQVYKRADVTVIAGQDAAGSSMSTANNVLVCDGDLRQERVWWTWERHTTACA